MTERVALCADRATPANPFRPLGPIRPHFWRVQRMARAVDVDLSAAMKDGRLSVADWAGMVTRCRGCVWTEGCARWLADTSDDGPRPVPGGCRNKARFKTLQDTQGSST